MGPSPVQFTAVTRLLLREKCDKRTRADLITPVSGGGAYSVTHAHLP